MIDTATFYRFAWFVRGSDKKENEYIFRNEDEEEVGTAIKKCRLPRDQIYITTKVSVHFIV